MNFRYLITVSLLFVLTATTLHGQSRRRRPVVPATLHIEDLPQQPLDTLATDDPETRIIIFSNNTWRYYRPALKVRDSLPVYMQHWDTSQVFAYKSIAYEDLPSVVDLNLVKDLSGFKAPVVGSVLSKYGPRGRRNHHGVDIPLKIGEPIYAAFDGKIRYAKYNTGGFGNLVIVRHENGLETWHAHLSKLNVKVNDYVKCGQVIGFCGSTGRSRGPHLHFEMRYCDQTFDPEFIVDFQTGQLKYQTFALEKQFFNIHSRASEILEEDDDDFPLLASAEGDTASGDILERIAAAQKKEEQQTKTATVSSSNAVYHTIKQGDILGRLALKYGVSVSQICRLNNITPKTVLKLGRRLRIK